MQFAPAKQANELESVRPTTEEEKRDKAEDLIVSPSCVQCHVKRSAIAELKIVVQNLHNDE